MCTVQHTKKTGVIDTGDVDVLNAEEVAVEFPLERIRRIFAQRCMWIVFKIDIVCEHIVSRKGRRTVIDCSEFLFRADQLIVVVCRRCSCAVDLIVRRCGHTAALISDMGIAAVCRIGVKYNSACRRVHVCRIEEADVLAVHLDGIRRDVLAHIDDIRLQCSGRTQR